MSVRVTDKQTAALYDSTTGIAFGPVFESTADAEDFLQWLHAEHDGVDARECNPTHLATLAAAWTELRDEEAAAL